MDEELIEDTGTRKRRHGTIYVLLALLFVVQIGMGAAIYALLQQRFTSKKSESASEALDSAVLSAFEERINTLENELAEANDALTQMQEQNPQASADTEAIVSELEALRTRLSALEQPDELSDPIGPMTQAQLERINIMVNDVRQMKQQMEENGSHQWQMIQLLTSFDRLEERVLSSEPYVQALQTFRIAAANMPESTLWIRDLRSMQHEGMPSDSDLEQRFAAAREAALTHHGEQANSDEPSVWQEAKQNLSDLVKIRKTGAAHSGNDAESVLARAEYALEQREYEQLMSELSNLPKAKRAYFDELQNAIEGRKRLLETLDTIRASLSAQIEAN